MFCIKYSFVGLNSAPNKSHLLLAGISKIREPQQAQYEWF